MRRTLAVLGVLALAVIGIAGPANASEINAQTDLVFSNDTGISDGTELTGIQPDPSAPHNEAWYVIENPTGTSENLEGLNVQACIADEPNPVQFMDDAPNGYVSTDVVPANGDFKTADPNYTGLDEDLNWNNAPSGSVHSDTFHFVLFIESSFMGIDESINDPNGDLDPNCVSQLPTVS